MTRLKTKTRDYYMLALIRGATKAGAHGLRNTDDMDPEEAEMLNRAMRHSGEKHEGGFDTCKECHPDALGEE